MKIILIGIVAALLSGCVAHQQRTELWRWVGDEDVTENLQRDRAACRHEWRTVGGSRSYTPQIPGSNPYARGAQNMANAMGGGMTPAFYHDCMTVKGWQFVGYE